MKAIFKRLFGGIKGLAFLLAVATALALYLYTQRIVGQLRAEARGLVQFYAQMYARVADTESPGDLSFIFDQIIQRTSFPLIQTDDRKNPIGWKGIGIDPDDKSEQSLRKIQRMVRRMDGEIEPVPIKYQNQILGYLYYSDSRMIQQLRWLPAIEVGIVALFILVGFFGYANIKQSEQRHIWVGMAKETAHQLGTPISSLLGWLEILRSGPSPRPVGLVDDMEKDLRRLQQVSQRFSQIGSRPDLVRTGIVPILQEAVEYIRRRAPQIGNRVEIAESYAVHPVLPLNPGLFQWAVENVLKNALDAMDKKDGRIDVRVLPAEKNLRAAVEITDNGRGMDIRAQKRAFRPGYSTKKRGWGLGLTLARRIVEEYHGGTLFIRESAPGRGTVIRIEL